jgi:Ankyrin repeats (3 copies)
MTEHKSGEEKLRQTQVKLVGDVVVECLRKSGGDVNCTDVDVYLSWQLLIRACHEGNYYIVKLLIDLNADVNTTDYFMRTSLHFATKCNHKNIVKLLLQHNSNINFVDNADNTPLHYAIGHGDFDTINLLLDPNRKVLEIDDRGGKFDPADNVAIVKLLLAHHADLNRANNKGETPLHKTTLLDAYCIQRPVEKLLSGSYKCFLKSVVQMLEQQTGTDKLLLTLRSI